MERDHVRLASVAVLFAVGVAQGADAITFARLMLEHGSQAEANPLVASGVDALGLLPMLLAKLALVSLVVGVFAVVARTHGRIGSLVGTVAMVAGLVGAFSNLAALMPVGLWVVAVAP